MGLRSISILIEGPPESSSGGPSALFERQYLFRNLMKGCLRTLFWYALTCSASLCLIGLLLVFPRFGMAESCPSMEGPMAQGAYGVADLQGRIIAGCNLDKPLPPASIIKIATALAALKTLGPGYRFRTEVYQDAEGNLSIKGYGDPTLNSEEVARLVSELANKGVKQIASLYIDDSAFALTGQTPGQENSDNPYDAPVGAVSVNFNSVPIVKDARGIRSGEAQTPLLPLMQKLARNRAAGQMRINICVGGADPEERMARYAGELFRAFFAQAGIATQSLGGRRKVGAESRLIHTHESRQTLEEMCASMLRYSSNFIANLIFLHIGAQQHGYPATWDKGRASLRQALITQLGEHSASSLAQVEGSGLSRNNQVSARGMLELLQHFRPHAQLLRVERGVAIKSGTLTGVYNYAGYLPNGAAFVLLLHQHKNTREPLMERIKAQYGRQPMTRQAQ